MQKVLLALALSLATISPLRADEVEDGINAALKSYKEGKPAEAVSALQKVLKQLGEKSSGAVAAALPDRIGSWIGGTVATHSLGGTGGSTTTRTYQQRGNDADDDRKVTVSIASDSPLLSQISTFLKAPALGKLLGAKPKMVGSNPAMYLAKEGVVQFAVDKRYVVLVQGKKAAGEELLQIAEGVKVEVLKDIR